LEKYEESLHIFEAIYGHDHPHITMVKQNIENTKSRLRNGLKNTNRNTSNSVNKTRFDRCLMPWGYSSDKIFV